MFQLLKNPDFQFMTRGRLFISMSLGVVLLSIGVLLVNGLNKGIEFTGGTEVQIKYVDRPDVGAIRSALERAGLTSQSVTTIGDPSENEVYIRLGADPAAGPAAPDADELTTKVAETLRAGSIEPGRADLNIADRQTLVLLLRDAPGSSPVRAAELAAGISAARKEQAIFGSVGEVATVEGMTPEIVAFLEEKAYVGPLALRSQSYIGPAIGEELLDKAKLAILLSLLMMLIYIWIRFQFQWGLAAVLALAHDTLITLGLFAMFGMEMTLPVVAAFLTLVGYSVNDTVVVFDRIRENLQLRARPTLEQTINLSINQTLGRTIITSGLTWIVVFGLYLFGGPALEPFAFVLSVGVVVGTYSSIYIASPILMIWEDLRQRRAGAAPAVAGPRTAKKVRSTSSGRA